MNHDNNRLPSNQSLAATTTTNTNAHSSSSLEQGMPNVLLPALPWMDDTHDPAPFRRRSSTATQDAGSTNCKSVAAATAFNDKTSSCTDTVCCLPPSLPKRQRSMDWMDDELLDESESSDDSEDSLHVFQGDAVLPATNGTRPSHEASRTTAATVPHQCHASPTTTNRTTTNRTQDHHDTSWNDDRTLATQDETTLASAASFTPNNSHSETSAEPTAALSLDQDDLVWLELQLEQGNAVQPLFCPNTTGSTTSSTSSSKPHTTATAMARPSLARPPTTTTTTTTTTTSLTNSRRRLFRTNTTNTTNRRGQSDRHLLELVPIDKRKIRLEKLKRHSTGSMGLGALLHHGMRRRGRNVTNTTTTTTPTTTTTTTESLLQQMEALSEKLQHAQELADRFDDDTWRVHHRDARWKSQW